jgi:hypothetical protein
MNELLKNKKVIIVGPCKSLVNKNKGVFIDSFDIIVRIKKGYPILENRTNDLGSKTDLLYSNLRMDNNTNNLEKTHIIQMNNNNVLLVYPQPLVKPYLLRYNFFKKQYPKQNIVINKKYENYNNFKKICNAEPTIMTFAIMHLLQFDLESLTCIGFSFRENGYLEEYKTIEQDKESFERTYLSVYKSHNLENEKKHFFNLLKSDTRLKYIDTHIKIPELNK